ncbi:MAG: hypothetical protein KBH99_07530 [Syntrophobacteraceae bacterium]|nr:hypothetical protein [Syntrophobacteraceae bacterium]
MVKKGIDDDQLMEEFDEDGGIEYDQSDELDFTGEDELLIEEGEEEDISPSVLYKGVSRPKTDEDWRQLLLDASRDGVPEYRMSDSYKEGDLIIHPSFGLGVVSKVISPRKAEVIFEDKKRLMAMGIVPTGDAPAGGGTER